MALSGGLSALGNPDSLLRTMGLGGIAGAATDLLLGIAGGVLLRALFGDAKDHSWELEAADWDVQNKLELYIPGQGIPDRFEAADAVSVVTSGGWLTFDPSTTPTTKEAPGWNLEQTWVAPDRTVDLKPLCVALELLTRRHVDLGRPPKMRLRYLHVDEDVWVNTCTWTTPHATFPGTSNPIAVKASLQLVRAHEHTLTEAPLFPRETSWRTLGAGETFEDVALEKYGDPAYGVLLRRINPELLEEYPGAKVKLLELDHPDMQGSLDPIAPCFLEDRADILQEMGLTLSERPSVGWGVLEQFGDMEAVTRGLYDAGD